MLNEIMWLLGGGVVGIAIGVTWINIDGRVKAAKKSKETFQPRERPRKSSKFEANSGNGARQSKARIIGPK